MKLGKWFLLVLMLACLLCLAGISCGDDDDDDDDDNDTAADDDDTTDDDDFVDDDDDDDVTDDDDDTVDDDDDTVDDDDDTVDDDDDTVDDDDDVTDDDDDTVSSCDGVILDDPNDLGPYTVTVGEYGHDGDPNARTTNIQAYFNLPDIYVWITRGISMNAVPLHGLGHYPNGAGPFPLLLIAHGNHDPSDLSYPGYQYLTERLASYGIIAVSIEEDFLNGSVSGEMDARGIVFLRHLQLFREWNEDPAHPLYGKVDMNRIALAGHSRGGEAVGAAWYFNTVDHNPSDPLFDFNFNITSLFAIAPVDGQLFTFGFNQVILKDVNYFIMHGSHDGDVSDFQGMQMYDRAFPEDESTTGHKAALFVQGANHGQWNTVWAPQGDPYTCTSPDTQLISAADQQQTAINFMTAFMRWTLLGDDCYRLMFAGEQTFASWPSGVVSNRQYQNADRALIDHYEEDINKNTASWAGGTNSAGGVQGWAEQAMYPGETRSCFLTWNSPGSWYRVDLNPVKTDLDDMDMLAFRTGQIYETSDIYNVHGQSQDFSVALVINGVTSDALPVSDYRDLVSPITTNVFGNNSKSVFDTVRIPLEDFTGSAVLPSDVDAVIFQFDQKPSGSIGIDDIRFTVQ